MYTIEDFRAGQRVQMHPGTDQWMMGARYGDVRRVGKRTLLVKLDKIARPLSIPPSQIGEIL